MNTAVTSDLSQNVIVTLYLLFSHNYIAFAYLAGLILSIILSIYRPSRFTTFAFLGFAILLFSFEYDKHLISAFRDQTVKSFITTQPHFKLQRLLELIISEILPVLFYVSGWICLFVAIIYAAVRLNLSKGEMNRNKKK